MTQLKIILAFFLVQSYKLILSLALEQKMVMIISLQICWYPRSFPVKWWTKKCHVLLAMLVSLKIFHHALLTIWFTASIWLSVDLTNLAVKSTRYGPLITSKPAPWTMAMHLVYIQHMAFQDFSVDQIFVLVPSTGAMNTRKYTTTTCFKKIAPN